MVKAGGKKAEAGWVQEKGEKKAVGWVEEVVGVGLGE